MKHELFSQIHSDIFHTNDGPVTQFVAIYRAMQLSANGEHNYEDIANVLHEGLKEFKQIPSTEFSYQFSRD